MIRWFRLLLCTCVASVTMLSGCAASSESLIAPPPTATPAEEVAPLASNGPQPQNMTILTPPSTKFARSEWVFDLSKTYQNPYYFYDSSDTPAANPPIDELVRGEWGER